MDYEIEKIIKNALNEDIGRADITTTAIVHDTTMGEGIFLVKQNGMLAGFEIAENVLKLVDNNLKFKKFFKDGDKVKKGDIAARVTGKASSILTSERTALNFFQRMSGIATAANKYQEKISHTKAQIIDTRKTVPGLRLIDKLAFKLSGCANHRMGLYDMFLIKDNHISAAGSITNAMKKCKDYRKKFNLDSKIEVETTNIEQVTEALDCEVDIIMLDNFNPAEMKKAVELINGNAEIEASGNITLDTVKEIAETGVDYISVGAITHSVKALDISLELNIMSQN
ncbi:MAG: carboxylating nicotinate-nucleotide diphosphorylase [Ignavibacteriaceae bacterium]